ncbi:MAG: cellulose biosynthesis protein BcsQ [Comamonas sp.]
MRLIALTAPAGGVGCTTVAAHMALMLQAMGHACLALELHPRNQLGVHLGLPYPVQSGWAAPAAQGQWWGDAAVAAANGLLFLPYGPSNMAQQQRLSQHLLATPQWLHHQLQALALPADTLVIADVGPPTSPLAWQALTAAHAVVCCTTPALDSVHALAPLHASLPSTMAQDRFRILTCRVDARRPSHQRGVALLRTHWREHLLDDVVHEDEAVPQSWSQGSPVQLHAPHALSSHDLQGVAHSVHLWLATPSVAPA